MKCLKCAAELAEDDVFCSKCGSKVEDEIASSEAESLEATTAPRKKGIRDLFEFWNKSCTFCKIEIISLAVVLALLIASVCTLKAAPIIISAVQLCGLIAALLIHKNIIKCSFGWVKYVILVISILLTILNTLSYSWTGDVYADNGASRPAGVETPCSADDFEGKKLEDAKNDLELAGFTNVTEEPLEDLELSEKSKFGIVDSVSINGVDGFKGNKKFKSNAKVIIRYHSYKCAETPFSSEDMKAMDVEDIVKAFKNAGFVNVTTDEQYDLDPDTAEAEVENRVSIDETDHFEKDSRFPINAEIRVVVHRPYEKHTLKVIINFTSNILFNRYDVDLEIGDNIEFLTHGENAEYEYRLKEGEYTLTFTSAELSSVKGSVKVDLTGDTEAAFKITCESDEIAIETQYVENKSEIGENQAMVPVSAANCKHDNYKDVEKAFRDAGFVNIKTEVLYDIVWGLTDVGEVEKVTVGGTTDFKRGEIFTKDSPVVITYHMNKADNPQSNVDTTDDTSTEDTTTGFGTSITVENDSEFSSLMLVTGATDYTAIKAFADSHLGDIIEFDGCIALMASHEGYTTRYDVCIVGGDYGADESHGPLFAFEDVNFYGMNVTGADTVAEGMNFRIIAEISGYSEDGGYIILKPVKLTAR